MHLSKLAYPDMAAKASGAMPEGEGLSTRAPASMRAKAQSIWVCSQAINRGALFIEEARESCCPMSAPWLIKRRRHERLPW